VTRDTSIAPPNHNTPLEPRPIRILRALADASLQTLSTPALVGRLAEGIQPNQRALSWYGRILRSHEERGLVQRAGTAAAAYNNVPSILWRITPAGRAWLRDCDMAAAQAAQWAAEQAERDAQTARIAALREEAADEATAKYGPGTPASVRRAAVPALREVGLTLERIGVIFGVSRKQIRLDLLPRKPCRRVMPPKPPKLTRHSATVLDVLVQALAAAAERERIRQLAIDTAAAERERIRQLAIDTAAVCTTSDGRATASAFLIEGDGE